MVVTEIGLEPAIGRDGLEGADGGVDLDRGRPARDVDFIGGIGIEITVNIVENRRGLVRFLAAVMDRTVAGRVRGLALLGPAIRFAGSARTHIRAKHETHGPIPEHRPHGVRVKLQRDHGRWSGAAPGVVRAQVDAHGVGGEKLQLAAESCGVVVAQPEVVVIVGVCPHVTALLPLHQGDSGRHVIGDRNVERTVELRVVVLAGGERQLRVELVHGRAPADQIDSAGQRIASEQGALRAAQHLGALQVHQVHHAADGPGDVDAVHIDADRRVGIDDEVQLSDAAYEYRRRRRESARGSGLLNVDIGRGLRNVGDIEVAAKIHLVFGVRGHRDGRVLQRFLAPSRRHHDFLDGEGVGGRPLGACLSQRKEGQQQRRKYKANFLETHQSLPIHYHLGTRRRTITAKHQ